MLRPPTVPVVARAEERIEFAAIGVSAGRPLQAAAPVAVAVVAAGDRRIHVEAAGEIGAVKTELAAIDGAVAAIFQIGPGVGIAGVDAQGQVEA